MKNIKKFMLFFFIMVMTCLFVFNDMRIKNAHVQEFTEDLKNADALVFGSSHAYINLNGAVLWEKYGIASACLAQGQQPLCMTYYELKSVLRYSKPEVVIVEPYMAITESTYNSEPDKYVNALLSFPIWVNLDCRIEAIRELSDVNCLEYILGFPVYHSDYKSSQFGIMESSKTAGYEIVPYGRREDSQLPDRCNSDNLTEIARLNESTTNYLYRIIDLCKEESVTLLFVLAPYQMPADQAMKLNAVKEIAEEQGIEYLDMNNYIDEIGINLDTEMADWGHALISGSEKNSIWLGRYLQEEYGLINRHGDSEYETWNIIYDAYEEIKSGISES